MTDSPAAPSDDQIPEVLPETTPSSAGSTRWRLRALWGVLAAIVVGVGAVAVNSADDDPPRLPLALGAEGAGKEAAMSDMSMLANIVYVAGPELPSLGDDAVAYKLSGDADEATVQRIADALDLDGDPQQEGRVWRVTDGQHTLEVNPGMGASWWYGDTSATKSSIEVDESAAGCVEPAVSSDGVVAHDALCVPVTTIPTPAKDLPTEAEARQIALDLLEATGVDTDDAVVTVDGPYEGWYVNVEVAQDGLPTGLYSSVTVGPKGAIQWASGTIADAGELGSYATVDTKAAIDRLNAGYGGFAGADYDYGSNMASDTATASSGATEPAMEPSVDPAVGQAIDPGVIQCSTSPDGTQTCSASGYGCTDVPVTTIVGSEITPEEAAAGCADVAPYEPSEPVEVVLDDAEPILMLVGATDGTDDGYLVPGYRFRGADGVVVDQIAIADDALAPVGAPYPGAPTDTRGEPGQIEPAYPTMTTTPPPAGGGSTGYDPDGSVSSPINNDPTPSLPPDAPVPCTLPAPGPNGEVPLIGCAEAVPAG